MDATSERDGYPLGRAGRVVLVLWGLFLLFGFSLAADVQPDPRGYGTHQRFGLPPCTFRVMFGISCPSCGMTTSFSNFVRGRLFASAQANVAGLLLAFLCAVQIPWSLFSAWRGRLWKVSQPDVALLWMLVAVCSISLIQWGIRLFLD